MFVKEITAVCVATEAKLSRNLTLADNLKKWGSEITMDIPQSEELEALGSGDEVRVTIEFVQSAAGVEADRQAVIDADNEDDDE